MLLNQNIDKLRTWLITVSSTIVGYSYSHNRLSCRWAATPILRKSAKIFQLRHYRFLFDTSSLARFRDCGLLRLHLLVLSHALSCELGARSYFRTIGYFASPKSYTLLLYFLFNTMAKFVCIKDAQWTTRCTFDHSSLLSATQSSPFCSLCYQLTFVHSSYLSI